MIKKLVIITCLLCSIGILAIDHQSFKNKDKYELLTDKTIGARDSFNYEIQFVPPEGKKVNDATYVKVWEEINHKWIEVETVVVGEATYEYTNQNLLRNVLLKNKNSNIALEIDFIYCSYSGGQCQQERYLQKIGRNKSKDDKVTLKLKI